MKTLFLSGVELIREYKELVTIVVIVIVIKILLQIKQSAKLDFKVLLLNAAIAACLGVIASMVVMETDLDKWKQFLIVGGATWIAAKMDGYIYKVLDIGVNILKTKGEKLNETGEEKGE